MSELIDPKHRRRDLRILETAVKKFPMTAEMYERVSAVVDDVLQHGKHREQLTAAKIAIAIHNVNNAPSMPAVHNHLHVAAKDMDIEERRRSLIEKANRLGVS